MKDLEVNRNAHNGQDVVNPSISDSKGDKTENERSNWDTKRHHNRPDTHVLGSVLLEKCFDDDTRANRSSWADEEGRDGSAKSHGAVRVAVGAANVADQTANQRDEEDGSPAITLRERPPQQRRNSENANNLRGEVTRCLYGNAQVLGNVDESSHDRCSSKGTHHSMKSYED